MSNIRLTIDGQSIETTPGTTILDAAKSIGIQIPTLCLVKGVKPMTSCLVCVVKANGRFCPSCATKVVEGMEIESETPEVHDARKTAIELLLGDHAGDCLAPCQFGCPVSMDIPNMLRAIQHDDLESAITTIKADIAMPAVLGRVCGKPCEAGCRLKTVDDPVAICQMKRYVADWDLARETPYAPPLAKSTGKRVAVLGAGPAGLSATYYLRRAGHEVLLIERTTELGGRLVNESALPANVLNAEIATILATGVTIHAEDDSYTSPDALDRLTQEFDTVLLACGPLDEAIAKSWGVEQGRRGVEIQPSAYLTSREKVFAAGTILRGKNQVVRSVADGKEAAQAVSRYLSGAENIATEKPFSVRAGKLTEDETNELRKPVHESPRFEPVAETTEYSPSQAVEQAARCLHCDCRAVETCLLKKHAEEYGAATNRYGSTRPTITLDARHELILFEPGKCIKCGLCVEIASQEKEMLGLTFIGRGFDVRIAVPFDRSPHEAIGELAARCAEACPTAAIAMRDE